MSETPSDPESDRTIIRPKPGGNRAAPPAAPPPAANPFDEADSDRTIIRPKPGGARPAPRPAAASPPPAPAQPAAAPPAAPRDSASPPQGDPPPIFTIGGNKLAAVAEPLLLLLARLWNAPTKPFSGDLRESTIRAFRVFEQRAREIGVPMEQLRPAHYALCAAIDDVVLNTPWGGAAGWDAGTLTANFHQDKSGGERFFDQLTQLGRNPGKLLPVIELMYVCLSLGFMGPHRRAPDGADAVERVRRHTHDLIAANRDKLGPELSARWEGVSAPYVPGKARFPIWVIFSGAIAVVAGLFVLCMVGLNTASDDIYARMLSAPPATMPQITRAAIIVPPPPPPPAPEPTAIDRLRDALKPELDSQALALLGTPTSAVLRVNAGTLFPAGSATLNSKALPLLQRIAAVLKDELGHKGPPGEIQVNAYTDNQPIRTVKFPSNFKLSAARAEAARDVIQKAIGPIAGKPVTVAADGRADADPIAPNTSPEGRVQNQRLEIVLRRQP